MKKAGNQRDPLPHCHQSSVASFASVDNLRPAHTTAALLNASGSQDSDRETIVPAGAATSETQLRTSGKWFFEYVKRPFSANFVTLPATSAHSLLFSSLTPKPSLVLLTYSKTLLSSFLNYLCPVSMDHGFPSIPLGSMRWKQRMRRGIAVHSRHFSTHTFKKT
jgi:hypothetical protein